MPTRSTNHDPRSTSSNDLFCDGDKCELIITPHMPEQTELDVPEEAPTELVEENEGAGVGV